MTNLIIRPIYDIQGEGHISPFVGESVITTGIVTGVASNGFYLQDPYGDNNDATSDGIFVFTDSTPTVRIGDEVQVSGDIEEFRPSNRSNDLTLTQITNLTNIRVLSSNNSLPTAVVIGEDRTLPTEIIDDDDLTDFYESLEGMRVQINNAVAVSATNSFGEIWAVPGDGIAISDGDFNPERIQIDDTLLNGTSPMVNVGDELGTVTGVLSYSFGNFELQSTEAISATSGNLTPEITNTETLPIVDVKIKSEFAEEASDNDLILAPLTLPEPTIINGTAGSEKLTGTDNNDIITGFQGRDLLTGGGGNDQFVYTSERDAGDQITDFEVGSDKIVLTELFNNNGITVANYADAINQGFLSFASEDNYAVVLFDKDGSDDSNYQGVFRELEQEFPFPSLNTNSDGSQIFLVLENVDVVELHDASNFVI
ncbi:M10 family metallopeptidase C-terminal domain-containing protein [Moorena producens]|uniref:M10 family metallopeptidase C-terminal domain-containing protein n=1 Tax=Moorena producens TaxID=1155739 RepID=UPI003C742B1B